MRRRGRALFQVIIIRPFFATKWFLAVGRHSRGEDGTEHRGAGAAPAVRRGKVGGLARDRYTLALGWERGTAAGCYGTSINKMLPYSAFWDDLPFSSRR